jgi:hypothetical protein
MNLSGRVHAGKCMTCFEAGIYISAFLALLVATACFLWHPNESDASLYDNMLVCNDPYTVVAGTPYNTFSYSSPCSSTVNIYTRFTNILQLYFAFYVI